MWLAALLAGLACSDGEVSSEHAIAGGNERVPAEWTVFEDTSRAGEVTTASLQLPAAKDIPGLLEGEGSRLILRCVDGQIQAAIETEPADPDETGEGRAAVPGQTVTIQLDSAPACE